MSRFQLFSVCAAALVLGGLAAIPAQAAQAQAGRARAQPALDWHQFLHGPEHGSLSLATAFTPANARSVRRVWHWQPPAAAGKPAPALEASPTVVAGRVYLGAESGVFYALTEATGKVVWSRQLGIRPAGNCRPLGITATAAVLRDPVTGANTVYVSGARYLYALNAGTGAVVWRTEIGPPSASDPDAYYNWSSPTVAGGHIYVGLASGCDRPLIRGGVVELDQHTGQVLNTWHSVPAGSIGGSVWSSVAASADGQDLWVSTGNECAPPISTCPAGNQVGNALSIVHLSGSLTQLQSWLTPRNTGHDWGFGSSPTLFQGSATPLSVGACNKNGRYYALTANPLGGSPLWTDTVAATNFTEQGACFASADWNPSAGDLYVGGGAITIGGTKYGGSVDEVNPATGAYIWRTGLPCVVVGTPTLDSAGVLAVGTFYRFSSNTPGAYLLNAATGAILTKLPVGTTRVFGQPVFAQGTLFVATETNGLYNFAP